MNTPNVITIATAGMLITLGLGAAAEIDAKRIQYQACLREHNPHGQLTFTNHIAWRRADLSCRR